MDYETNGVPVRFETREALQVVGLQITCHPSLLPILLPTLWQAVTNRLTTISHRLQSDDVFNVHRQHGEEDTQCICVAVSSVQDLPPGMVSFEVPAQSYVVFRHTGSLAEIAGSYQEIQRWLSEHADYYRSLPIMQVFPFEVYSLPLNLAEDQLHCEIYIPIEEVIPALRGLDDIDWSQLNGCYGTGDAIADLQRPPGSENAKGVRFASVNAQQRQLTSVPAMLRQLTSEDAEQRQHAFRVLYYNLEHQGSLYSASAAVAPFISKLLHEPAAPEKAALLRLLTVFAQHYHVDDKPRRPSIPFLRTEEINDMLMKGYQHDVHWGERTHNAVGKGITDYLPFLASSDPQLCVAALCLLGCFKEERVLIVPHLQTLLETTTGEYIQAYTLYCLGALLTAADEATSLLIPYLSIDRPEGVRLSAAIALCAAMREHLSEDMLERIHNADVYPHARLRDHYGMHEHWQYAEWLDRQAKYFLAIMSVATSENCFIPQPFRIPPEFNTIFGNISGMPQPPEVENIHYPPWFNQYYAEGAGSMLLRFCFPAGKIPVQTRYHDLNKRQERLLSMLAEHKVFWPDQRPHIMRGQAEARFRNMEERFGSMDISQETRASLSFLKPSQQGSYEEELDASNIVQLLRQLGLPATQEALQAYVSS